MAGSVYFERRSLRLALETYLANAGWTGLTFDEGFMSQQTIQVPLVTVEIVKPNKKSLQLGGSETFKRIFQIDCYMESEPRVIRLNDDIMDFMDLIPIVIADNNSNVLGSLICQDTDSINSETMPPVLVNPKLTRWRGITRGIYEANYQ